MKVNKIIKYQLTLRSIFNRVYAIVVAISLSACSNTLNSKKNIHPKSYITENIGNLSSSLQTSQNRLEKMRNLDIKLRIMNQYANWKGVRYHLGGSTKKGIDCSAFVQRTFREQFGLELPRSTYKQKEIGKPISRSDLRTGDLILFRTNSSTGRHVGIYIDNDQFVHVSVSNGVMISDLNKPYWKKRYNEARRVLTYS